MYAAIPLMRTPGSCATTGIGSLPHRDIEAALKLSFRHDVPFLPQLPSLSPGELMIPAALEGMSGLQIDGQGACTLEPDARSERVFSFGAAWEPFIAEVKKQRPQRVKLQLAGPATVRWLTKTPDGQPVDADAALRGRVLEHLTAKAVAMVRQVGAETIFFLDEPGFYALDAQAHRLVLDELVALVSALKREGATVGLHCCANTDWAALKRLEVDLLSIDARLSLEQVEPLGFSLSLGIIPTDPEPFSLEVLLAKVKSKPQLLTTACGLALHSEAEAERLLALLFEAQRRLR